MHARHRFWTLAAAAALAVPSAAFADQGNGHGNHPGKGHHEHHNSGHHKGAGHHRALVFKGTIVTSDAAGGQISVAVTGGNHATKTYRGQTVAFSISSARLVVADRDADGRPNEAADLRAGDKVVVKVRLAKGQVPAQPFAARQVVDQDHSA